MASRSQRTRPVDSEWGGNLSLAKRERERERQLIRTLLVVMIDDSYTGLCYRAVMALIDLGR